jgi:phospholipid/cholesterol/gamma-HCH transport system ATP-binding protein
MEPVVECRDLACGYEDVAVLEHVDMRVERGELVAILGRSGSGKSTLLRTLIGLQPPLAGEVRMFGRPLYDVEERERRQLVRRLGVVFQNGALFSSLSLEDNVALPLRELTRLRASAVAEIVRLKLGLVGLDGLQQRLPAQLSGGQRQRGAIARASALDPEVLACDEPTANLDPIAAAGIDDVLVRYRNLLGTTLIVVSHEIASIRAIATRAVMVEGGTIRASGTVDELARSDDRRVFEFFHPMHTARST